MKFTLIKGTFIPDIPYARPDGDSIRFQPDGLAPFFNLPRWGACPNVGGENTVQLRYEGIDAMEKDAIEPFASAATAKNREILGVPNENDEARGYILTRQIDIYGRPIAFVFAGDAPEKKEDGACVELCVDWLKKSVNFELLKEGFVYPIFYHTLATDLRLTLMEATQAARSCGKDIWKADKTQVGVTWDGKGSLATMDPIFPKIWRRLQGYTRHKDYRKKSGTLERFGKYVRRVKHDQDKVLVLPDSQGKPELGFTDLVEILEIEKDTVKMRFPPERLIFVSGAPRLQR